MKLSRTPQSDRDETIGPVLGIDLGTTHSLAAILETDGPRILPNSQGETLTPSVVSVAEDGALLVGSAAIELLESHPDRTAASFKRDMGTARRIVLGNQSFLPQELSAIVLRQLRESSELALHTRISRAVISVPAYFNDLQRTATKEAAEIAGLEVVRLINEPTAAALAYGLYRLDHDAKVIVLDLGGGTFDVSVLEIIEGVIEIQATAGDSRLGGDDFSMALVELVLERPETAEFADSLRQSPSGWRLLVREVDKLKRRLSSVDFASFAIPSLPLADGRRIDLQATIQRGEAERAWRPLLDRMERPIRQALGDAELSPFAVDQVLMVGGASRMPSVTRLAASFFGKLPQHPVPPDEAVALGAAVQAALAAGHERVEDLVVTDIAPFSLGIAIQAEPPSTFRPITHQINDLFAPIIERGTVIPCSRYRTFSTVDDNQQTVELRIYQGEHFRCSKNLRLGSLMVRGIPKGPAGGQSITVRFTYDLNGLLEVESTVDATSAKTSTVIERAEGQMSGKEIREARKRMQRFKILQEELLPNATVLEQASKLYEQMRGPRREWLSRAICSFQTALEEQDPERIAQERQDLRSVLKWLKEETQV